jgi:DNA-binding CsgD family transcriptional regulator
MKVSNCCGVSGNKHTDIDPYCNEFYVDIEVCPKCKEHCEYVDESEPAPKPGSRKVFIEVEFKDHDRVILTNQYGDTYTSKSEELIDFLHEKQPAPKPKEGEGIKKWNMKKAINQYSYKNKNGIVLTNNQLKIFGLVAEGYNFKQISSILKSHLRCIHYSVSRAVKMNNVASVHNLIWVMAKKDIL